MGQTQTPDLKGLLEATLFVEDLGTARAFYEKTLGLKVFDASDFEAWQIRLECQGIEILSEVTWERGGRSLYFRDPDGHLLELATPGVWDVY